MLLLLLLLLLLYCIILIINDIISTIISIIIIIVTLFTHRQDHFYNFVLMKMIFLFKVVSSFILYYFHFPPLNLKSIPSSSVVKTRINLSLFFFTTSVALHHPKFLLEPFFTLFCDLCHFCCNGQQINCVVNEINSNDLSLPEDNNFEGLYRICHIIRTPTLVH